MQIYPRRYFEICGFSYRVTQLLNQVSKEQGLRGEYAKNWGPELGRFIDRGLSGALNGAKVWTGAGARGERENSPPQAIDWGGAGNWGRCGQFCSPVTNPSHNLTIIQLQSAKVPIFQLYPMRHVRDRGLNYKTVVDV